MFHLNSRPVLGAVLTAAALSLAACGGGSTASTGAAVSATSAATPHESMTPHESGTAAATKAGAYLTKAQYQEQMSTRTGTKVVYFFYASWCPDCRAADASLKADGVPAGITVVQVDFDTETELRKTYGVTQQTTFVEVAPDGKALKTWTGSKSGADIAAQVV